MARGVRGRETHRNSLLNNTRAAAASSGRRPSASLVAARGWCVLPDGSVAAAACNVPTELVVLRATGARTNSLERGRRACLGGVIQALCARGGLVFAGLADGRVVVARPGGRDDEPSIVGAVEVGRRPVVMLEPLANPRLVLAVDGGGGVRVVAGSPKSARATGVCEMGTRMTACVARRTRPAAPWEAAVAGADGVVRVVNASGARVVDGCEFGDCRALAWADDDGKRLLVGGEDDMVASVRVAPASSSSAGESTKQMRTRPAGDGPCEAVHSSFVTGIARRGRRAVSVGMDGRVVMWDEAGLGETLIRMETEAFYKVEWPVEDVVYASSVADSISKVYLYRIALEETGGG